MAWLPSQRTPGDTPGFVAPPHRTSKYAFGGAPRQERPQTHSARSATPFGALAVALTLSFVATDATAQKRKKTPKKAQKAEVQALTQSGPVLKYEQFRRRVEIKVAAKREEQISGLKRLLDLGPDEAEIPDIKFRLAELYFGKSQFYFFRANEADDSANRAKDPSQRSEFVSQKRQHDKESKIWSQEAMKIYEEIREGYPKYPRMPEVLFALGQNLWSTGRYDDAVAVYGELIKNYEKSPLVADAWLAFGEYYFNNAALHRALKSYEYAASDKRSRVYGFALYKQGWCYYNLSDWKKALNKFRATVFYSEASEDIGGENRISLAREAQKDFVKTYAHVGDARKARYELADLLSEDDCKSEKCLKLLEGLGSVWAEQGQFEDASILFSQLIKERPGNTRNPYYQGKIVDLTSRGGNKDRVIAETRRLVDLYNGLADVVAKSTGGDAKAQEARQNLEEAKVLAESTVRRLAQLWNREASKTRQKKTYTHALALYSDYLKLWPTTKYAYEMRFQMADLLYKLERFDEAATAYRQTVEADPKGKYVVDAANDGILAVEEHLKDLRLKRPKASAHQIDIHEQRQRLIRACDLYIKYVPGDKATQLVKIKFKVAKVYYDHNHFAEALRRFEALLDQHPKHEEAEFAANLVIDVHNLAEDWENLYSAASRYLKNEDLIRERDKLRGDLQKFGQYAKFKLIKILQDKLEKEQASLRPVAVSYEEFQAEFPESENADKALFNASVVWDSLGEKERADGLRRQLLKEYKDSPLRADVAFYTARSFEEQAHYRKAADLFANFTNTYENDERAQDALYNAAVFYAGVGAVQKATKLREEYLKRYGKQRGKEKEAADIYYSIAADLERAGRLKQAAQRFGEFAKNFSSDDRVFEALWRQSDLHIKLRQQSAADKIQDVLWATYNKRKKKGIKMPPSAADYASRIAFGRVDEDFSKYERLRIAKVNLRNPKRFKESLADKAKARQQMISAYTKIVTTYKQAYSTIASLYKIAISWDVFVTSLLKIPCPKTLTEEQCTFFKEGLEEQIGPARESAYQAYLTCVAKSNELNVFTPFSTKCVKALEDLAPEKYPPIEEQKVTYTPARDHITVQSNPLMLHTPDEGAGKSGGKEASP